MVGVSLVEDGDGRDGETWSGRLVDGRYRLRRLAGRGGMGLVYEAVDERHGRTVALKFLARHDDEEITARFEREARAMARLEDPTICRVFDVGRDGVLGPYFVMAFIPWPTLETVLSRGELGPGDPRQLLEIARSLAAGLELVHRAGMVHRDVKAANVFVSPEGRALLCDFGVAHVAEAETLTRTGDGIGTPACMAPEILDGRGGDARADVFQYGLVLHELLTGRPLFASGAERLARHGFPLVVEIDEGRLPPELWDLRRLALRCLRVSPSQRPADGAALVAALAARPHAGEGVPVRGDTARVPETVVCSPAPTPGPEGGEPGQGGGAGHADGEGGTGEEGRAPSRPGSLAVVAGALLLVLLLVGAFPGRGARDLRLGRFEVEPGVECLRIVAEVDRPCEARLELRQSGRIHREISPVSRRSHVFVMADLKPGLPCGVELSVTDGTATLRRAVEGLRVEERPRTGRVLVRARPRRAELVLPLEEKVAVAAVVVQCDRVSREVPVHVRDGALRARADGLDADRDWAFRVSLFRRPWERWSVGPFAVPREALAPPPRERSWGLYFAFPSLRPALRDRPFSPAAMDRIAALGVGRVLLAVGRHVNWTIEGADPVVQAFAARGIRVDVCLCHRRKPPEGGEEEGRIRRFFARRGKDVDRVVLGYTPDTDGWVEGPRRYGEWLARARSLIRAVEPRLEIEVGMLFSLANVAFLETLLEDVRREDCRAFSILNWTTSFRGAPSVADRLGRWQAIARKAGVGDRPWTVFAAYPSRVQNLNDTPVALLFDLRVPAGAGGPVGDEAKKVIEIGQNLGYSELDRDEARRVFVRDGVRARHGGARSVFWTVPHGLYGQLVDGEAGGADLDGRIWPSLGRLEAWLSPLRPVAGETETSALARLGLERRGGCDAPADVLPFEGARGSVLLILPRERDRPLSLGRTGARAGGLSAIALDEGGPGESVIRPFLAEGATRTAAVTAPILLLSDSAR